MSNLQLSAEEMKLVTNREWILTKRHIIEKVYVLFGDLAEQMQTRLLVYNPALAAQASPKISRGEQYEGLPYVVLDYPRLFTKNDVLAVRTFFWWGNYFSITLHLKGKFLSQHYHNLLLAMADKKLQDLHISFSGNEFNFNLSAAGYTAPGALIELPGEAATLPFFKVSYKISFDQLEEAGEKLLQVFLHYASLLGAD